MEDSRTLSGQLLCNETVTRADEKDLEEDTAFILSNYTFSEKEEEEHVQFLLKREDNGGLRRRESWSPAVDEWIKCARSDAIAWILKTSQSFGFQYQTAYLTVTYFDRFLSRRVIDREKRWAICLLQVACLSLAAKMEHRRAPAPSEFQLEDYDFDRKMINRMELLVLSTLEWRLISVTPFPYIHYFARKFSTEGSPPPENIISTAVEHILAVTRDEDFMCRRPSAMAGAATLVALDRKLTRQALEIKINTMTPGNFLEIGEVFSCYSRMKDLDMEKLKMLPSGSLSPYISPIRWRGIDVFQHSSVSSALGAKRKNLTFHEDDKQDHGTPSEKRNR
ncbi:hypothetical protein NMG60_11031243 [Bertholletia excelsa]